MKTKAKFVPVKIGGVAALSDILERHAQAQRTNPTPPPTAAEQAEIDALVKELSKDPGFFCINIGGGK